MEDSDVRVWVARVEERAKSNTHQISELKPVVNEIHTMSKTLVKLVQQMESTNKNLEKTNENVSTLNTKVDALEKEPGTRWTQLKTAMISALASAVVTGIVGALIYFN